MSIINWFNKPKWKSKDADIRAQAVNLDSSIELIAQLANISQNDESEKVRTIAVRRLEDYALIANIAQNDSHKTVKSAAFKMLQDWFTKHQDNAQLDIIKSISDSKTLEVAALNSKNSEIRKHCISQISKQGLLGDLLIQEKEKDIRALIIEKITKPATLKRILKLVKNKDKNIFKVIQSKLENDGDMEAIINQKALDLCEQMEKLIHNPNTSNKSDVESIHNKWKELNKDNKLSTYIQRFEGAHRTASLTFDPELRDEFIKQQKQQRINAKIIELKTTLKQSQDSSWEQLQTQISKFNSFELSHATEEQTKEYTEYLNTLRSLRDAQTKEQDIPEELIKVADKLDGILKSKYAQPKQLSDIRKQWDTQARKSKNNTAFHTLKNRFDNAILKLAEKVENSASLREEAAKNAVADIDKVRSLIKDGKLTDAKIAINKIAKNKNLAGNNKLINDHKFEFDTLWNELTELRKWQTWSNDKARIEIIEELKSLIGTGTHPDALLKKMKESNKQWKDMEEHEKLEGDRYGVRNQELFSQFRAVQKALFEPAQQFFEKRSEIWGKELEEVEKNIQALHDVDLIETSDRDLSRMVRDAIKQLRNLDNVPPKVRGKCASAIRSGTARIDAHLKESYKVAERRKEKLIEQAQELVELEDLDTAIEGAKSLQSEWKKAGIVHQSQERKLWKKFRTANDAVFNRISAQRDKLKQENQQLLDSAQTLINDTQKEIDSLSDAQAIQSTVEKFKSHWHDLNINQKSLKLKSENLIEKSEQKVASLANAETVDMLRVAQKFAVICQDLELNKIEKEAADSKIEKLKLEKIFDNKLLKLLNKRLSQVSESNSEFINGANSILISAEYLTGVATPDEYKEQRLAFQVDELSKRMSGELIVAEAEKAQQLLSDWFSLQGIDLEFIKTNDKRIKKLIKSLFELL